MPAMKRPAASTSFDSATVVGKRQCPATSVGPAPLLGQGAKAPSAAVSKAEKDSSDARVQAAEKRAQDAELEAARLRARDALMTSRLEKAEKELSEHKAKLRAVEARVAHAEGRAEALGEQARCGNEAIERAARAEERANVLGDLQAKLPMFINAVVQSSNPWASRGGGRSPDSLPPLQYPIKLELEDGAPAVRDPYIESVPGTPASHAPTTPQPQKNIASMEDSSEKQYEGGGSGFVKRAFGAMTMRRRQLNP
eukprot:TRINITY_DN22744_c0_g1_i1.p1 TRINITY_DN22744_c0_g1~~TRINITY_DN22744_c0_g1_i1.p1  ORF type:complete len:254 (-),score=66.65 TRINITY_DN22744_c0_g1_i1:41-802(-)